MDKVSAICIPLLTLIITLAFSFDLARFRFTRKRLYLIITMEILAIVIISSAVLIFAGLAVYAKWYVPMIVIPTFCMFMYISKYRDARDAFTIVTIIFLNFFITTPSMWFARFYENQYLYYNLARVVLFLLVFLCIHTVFRKHYLLAQEEIDKGWGVFSILPLLGSFILYYAFLQYGKKENFFEALSLVTITTVFMASVYVVIFYMFQQVHEKYVVQEQKRILAMQNKAQLDQFVLFKETAEKSNRRWHDLRHSTQALIELLESGDTNTAIAHLKNQLGLGAFTKEEYCQHPAVNSILCLWAERSRNDGIHISIEATIPRTLGIEPTELSALFANAIENAYLSCLELAQEMQRYIKVNAQYNGKRLAIGITNTCKGNVVFEGDLPLSAKEGGGIGTKSMVYTVKRFQGAYSFFAQDGLFNARFVLNV